MTKKRLNDINGIYILPPVPLEATGTCTRYDLI